MLLCVLIAVAIPALLILKRALARAAGRRQWPPGPPAWPIIGHLHLLGPLPHQALCNLAKRYGPLMGLRFGHVPVIVASSPDMAKAILQTHDLAFASRPASAAARHIFFHGANLGYTPHGPLFKRLRQLLASQLFSSKRLESSRRIRQEEVRELMLSVLQMASEKPQAPVELRASLLATSNNINCRMAVGKRMSETSSKLSTSSKRELLSMVEEVMYLMGVFSMGDFIPGMAWLDAQGYVKRMKAAGQRAQAVMQALLDERKQSHNARLKQGHAIAPNDLLDVLLLDSQDDTVPITDDNIKGLLMDLFIGGADTSSSTVEWALADLINHPEAMQKVQEELDAVVGKARFVEEADIPNLPYLGVVLKESMRLHPVAPLLIPHEATQGCQILGYQIPSKTRAYVNTWAIGRDPTIWERPLDFWPERFQNVNFDLEGNKFALLPFGSGRRKCPAMALAVLNTHLMLATLAQGFTWSLMPCDRPNINSHRHLLDLSESFKLALVMAKPLCAFAMPRLAIDLY